MMSKSFVPNTHARSFIRIACVLGLSLPSVAHAGFQWTPPAAAPQAETSPSDSAMPTGPLTPELDSDSLPVPVGHVDTAPVAKTEEPLKLDNAPAAAAPTPEDTATLPAPVVEDKPAPKADVPTLSDSVIEGFGKEIPLAMALRDIVPANLAYVFTPRDVAATKISWRGGKPWMDVLKAALDPHGLEANVNGNQLVISEKPVAEPAEPATPLPAAPMPPVAPAPEPAPVAVAPAPMPAEPMPIVAPVAPQPAPVAEAPVSKMSAPVMNADLKRKWEARPGATLRQTIESWSKSSGVEVNWSTPYDYPIESAFYFEGNYAQAVESLLSSYGGQNPAPKGRLYPNLPDGPSVLMIN